MDKSGEVDQGETPGASTEPSRTSKPGFNVRCGRREVHEPHEFTKHWRADDLGPSRFWTPGEEWDSHYQCPGLPAW